MSEFGCPQNSEAERKVGSDAIREYTKNLIAADHAENMAGCVLSAVRGAYMAEWPPIPPDELNRLQVPLVGALFRHIKTSGVYAVIGTCQLESSNRPGVLYASLTGDGPVWARDLVEFSDGRFRFIEPEALSGGHQ